jgi:hypothetical protein
MKIVKGKESLRATPTTTDTRELLRERYRPTRVRLLFVGESPPASGRFFYQADSGLYRAIRDVFFVALPVLKSTEFLESFQSLGCYLVDLCGKPVDRLNKYERNRVCAEGEARLTHSIAELQPRIIITLVRSISANVKRAQQQANWVGQNLDLPYPGRWLHHRVTFQELLTPVLRRELANLDFCDS